MPSLLAAVIPPTVGLPIPWWAFWWILLFFVFPLVWWVWFYRGVRHDRNMKQQLDRILAARDDLEHPEPPPPSDEDAYR
ncbi:MAG TPA: hypothetical protein VE088_04400 [Gaiellaceae bacterium]|jgi:hypothetical protein|nr:hypothetical protein [Gaiellaceae bacterium]